MSDELDYIPWSTIEHAYGYATDTPEHLRNLISPDPLVIQQAHSALSASIVHQGGVWPAALAAFPYLLRLFLTNSGRNRSYVSALVKIIIEGIAPPIPSLIPFGYFLNKRIQMEGDPDYAEAWTTVYPLVVKEFPNLLPLLHDPDEDIASKTLKIVACCLTVDGGLWKQVLPFALAEQRPLLQASYQFVAWASADPAALAWVSETFEQAQEPLVKFTAAFVMTQTAQPVPEAIYSWLIDTIKLNDLSLIENYNTLGLAHRFWFDCALALYHRPLSERAAIAEQCLAHLELRGLFLSHEDVTALLIIAFGRFHYKKSAIERGEIQARVVMGLAHQAFATVHRGYRVPQMMLKVFGLPWQPADINGFLGLPNAEHAGFAEKTKP